MDVDVLYPVCPHRNVPAAFERFYGPDSGGIARFFGDERADLAARFAVVHAQLVLISFAASSYGARAARALSNLASHRQLPLMLGARPGPASRLLLAAGKALPHPSRIVQEIVQFFGVRLACVRNLLAPHPQLSLLLGPQPVSALPV